MFCWPTQYLKMSQLQLAHPVSVSSASVDSTNLNQPWIENIWKETSYIVADMYYIVKPTMVASVLNMYRLFYHSLNNPE